MQLHPTTHSNMSFGPKISMEDNARKRNMACSQNVEEEVPTNWCRKLIPEKDQKKNPDNDMTTFYLDIK